MSSPEEQVKVVLDDVLSRCVQSERVNISLDKQAEKNKAAEAEKLVRKLRREAHERESRKKKIALAEKKAIEAEDRKSQEAEYQKQKRAYRIKMEELERKRQDRETRALERQRQFDVSFSQRSSHAIQISCL